MSEVRAIRANDLPVQGTVTVSLSGEVDVGDADRLGLELLSAVDPRTRVVVLDLSQVAYIGSEGVSALLTARRLLAEQSVELRLGPRPEIVDRVLEVTGVLEFLT